MFAPKGTSEAIQDKLNIAVNAALKTRELRAQLIPLAIDPTGGSREDYRQFLAAEKARLVLVAKVAQLKEDWRIAASPVRSETSRRLFGLAGAAA